MKNQKVSQERVNPKAEVSHLENTITDITSSTAHTLERWWKPFVLVVVAGLVGFLIYTLIQNASESKKEQLSERIYRLFQTAAAEEDTYKVDPAARDSLLSDVSGTTLAPFAYRTAVTYYLERAERMRQKAKNESEKETPPATGSTPPPPTPPVSYAAVAEEALAEAGRLVTEAKTKLPGDEEIQSWATKVVARIEGEKKKDWLPGKWKFALPPPKPVSGDTPPPATTPTPPAK